MEANAIKVDVNNEVGCGICQGCQIFLGEIYQSRQKYTKLQQNYQMPKIYQMVVNYFQMTRIYV
jgi:hypothetical protein